MSIAKVNINKQDNRSTVKEQMEQIKHLIHTVVHAPEKFPTKARKTRAKKGQA